MANEKLPQLPSLTAITGQDLFYVVDVSDTTDDPTGSSKGITRDDILQNITGLTATTISATTYQNLPVDPNYYTTAFTYSNNVFTISQTGQTDLTATINSVTGWTVNGNLTVTGNTSLQGVTATTISATTISATTVSATTISGTTFYGDGTNLTGVVKGAGTTNYLPRWTGTTGLGNSLIIDDGTNISIGPLVSPQTSQKVWLYTNNNPTSLRVTNGSITGSSVGIIVESNNGIGNQTGVLSSAIGHPTTGTSIGFQGFATNGLLGIGVYGQIGVGEGGGMITGIGGYFDARGSGENGYPTNSYGLQVIDGTEGVDKILQSQTSDGKSNWVDPSTIQTAFNYGISYTMLTGNYMI